MRNSSGVRLLGCLIRVPDMRKALGFYCGVLQFDERWRRGNAVCVAADPFLIFEEVSSAPPPAIDQARAMLGLQVDDIAGWIGRFNALRVPLTTGRPNRFPLGHADCFVDPLGNVHTILEIASGPVPKKPLIYNVCTKIPIGSLAAAKRLYCDILDFEISTERYYPPSVPLAHGDGTFAFMIHEPQNWERDVRPKASSYPNEIGSMLVFGTDDIHGLAARLASHAEQFPITPIRRFAFGLRMAVVDNSGIALEIWEIDAAEQAGLL